MNDIWYLIENEAEFRAHVKKHLGENGHVYGVYSDPEAYPVLVHKDYDIRYNSNGPDDILLSFYYPEHVTIVSENHEVKPA